MTKQELADLIIERLNEITEADPLAMEFLVEARVPCNDTLARHPSVQVIALGGNPPTVGVLGILNGIVGTIDEGPKKGWGLIAAVWDEGKFQGFRRMEPE